VTTEFESPNEDFNPVVCEATVEVGMLVDAGDAGVNCRTFGSATLGNDRAGGCAILP